MLCNVFLSRWLNNFLHITLHSQNYTIILDAMQQHAALSSSFLLIWKKKNKILNIYIIIMYKININNRK
jgi:hypothetical protein